MKRRPKRCTKRVDCKCVACERQQEHLQIMKYTGFAALVLLPFGAMITSILFGWPA